MKRILAVALCGLLLLAFAGCGAAGSAAQNTQQAGQTSSGVISAASASMAQSGSDESTAGDAVAVVYFSATGSTKAVAETLAAALGTSAAEIVPATPYTSDDLNYNNSACRANAEQNDDAARPAFTGDFSGIESCQTVYIGYPIWWGTNPKIIETFLDAYDLSAATVYTFCTSGGSGIETSVSHLQEQYPAVNIAGGHRFATGATAQDVQAWLDTLA